MGLAGRVIAVAVLVAALGYVVQLDDSFVRTAPSPAVAHAISGAPEATGGRDFHSVRRAVVPFGRSTLILPILVYHYIRVPPSRAVDPLGYNLSVSPRVFEEQMDWLASHGYHSVTFNDVRLYWQHVEPLPARPVIITLDDGYRDLYTTAYPILEAHGFTAVAYIVSGFVGTRGYVTRDQILEMDHYGIEIAAHTVNHVDLVRAPWGWLTYQLVQSRKWLESLVGHPVLDMAYPSGRYDETVIAAVQQAGYYSATTEWYSVLHKQADRFVWGRVRVTGGDPMSLFIANLGPTMPTVTISKIVINESVASLQQRF
jgi:peptidoglycan/xylan/chitin deacetylase (PgdA/CDA1 family)